MSERQSETSCELDQGTKACSYHVSLSLVIVHSDFDPELFAVPTQFTSPSLSFVDNKQSVPSCTLALQEPQSLVNTISFIL